MDKHCYSCGMPLGPETAKSKGQYCQYCSDAEGNLKPRAEVQAGIAHWLAGITPEDKASDYMQRADHYLQAMPAWAGK